MFAGFGKAPLAVKGQDVGEDAATTVEVDKVEKFKSHVFGRARKRAVDGRAVEVVDASVLVVKGAIKKTATEGMIRKHPSYKGFELYIAVVEFIRYRS